MNIEIDFKESWMDGTRFIEALDIGIDRVVANLRASLSRDTSRFSGNDSLLFLGVRNAGHDKVLLGLVLKGALWLSKPRNRNFHD